MSGFADALPVILKFEGGFVDDSDDRGGATNKGITQGTYDAWRRGRGVPTRSVKLLEDGEVLDIYHKGYWMAAKADAVPWPLSVGHFDAAVNHGVTNAWKIMQRALGVADDGIPGPKTLTALQLADPGNLVWEWLKARAAFYARIVQGSPSQAKFLRGWLNRVLDVHREMERLA